LPQEGNHGAASIASARIVDDGFKAVADFDAVLAVVGSYQQQNAGGVFFCANTEMFEQIHRVIFDRPIVERADGDDGHLCAGFLLQFGAQSFQTLASRGGNHTR